MTEKTLTVRVPKKELEELLCVLALHLPNIAKLLRAHIEFLEKRVEDFERTQLTDEEVRAFATLEVWARKFVKMLVAPARVVGEFALVLQQLDQARATKEGATDGVDQRS